MRHHVDYRCEDHPDPYDCADNVVVFVPKFREYGLIVHDGGRSYLVIKHCPWCGTRLPESARERWFEEIERLGLDPWQDEVPPEYEDGSWLAPDDHKAS